MAIFIKSSLDVVLMDHIFLSQIWTVVDHFYYYRWTHACANQYYLSWTELIHAHLKEIQLSCRTAGLYYREQQVNSNSGKQSRFLR